MGVGCGVHYGAEGVLGFGISWVSGAVLRVAVIHLRDRFLCCHWVRVGRSSQGGVAGVSSSVDVSLLG